MSMTLDRGLHRAMLLPAMISSSQCVHLEHPGNNIGALIITATRSAWCQGRASVLSLVQ